MGKQLMMRVQFDIEMSKLSLFTELLQKEVSNLSIVQTSNGIFQLKKRRQLNKASPARDEVIKLMRFRGVGGTLSTKPKGNVQKALEAINCSPASASPTCCTLMQEGYLERKEKGEYKIIKLPQEKK